MSEKLVLWTKTRRHAVVPILGVAIIVHEQVVTTGESIEIAVVLEVRTQGTSHCGLAAGNSEAVGNGDVIDEALERIVGLGRSEES